MMCFWEKNTQQMVLITAWKEKSFTKMSPVEFFLLNFLFEPIETMWRSHVLRLIHMEMETHKK